MKIIIYLILIFSIFSCGFTKRNNIKNYDNNFSKYNFSKSSVFWKLDLDSSNENSFNEKNYSSFLVLDNNTLVYSFKDYIYKVNYKKGNIIEKRKIPYFLMSGITRVDNNIIFFASDSTIHLLDFNFKEIWSYKLDSEKVSGNFYYDGENIIFKVTKDKLYSISKNGKLNWTTESNLSDFMPLNSNNNFLVKGDLLYSGFSNGKFIILNKSTGRTIYEENVSALEQFNDILDIPVLKNDIIYLASIAKGIVAIDLKVKSILFESKEPAFSRLHICEFGNYYFSKESLVEIDLTGKILNKYNLEIPRLESSFLYKNRYLIASSSEKGLFIIDLKTKENVFINISSGVSSLPYFVNDSEFIISSNKNSLYRIKILFKNN